MSWNTSTTGGNADWIPVLPVTSHPFRMRVNPLVSSIKLTTLSYVSSTNYQFKSGKTYQFVTDVYYYMNNSNPDSASFSISTPIELSSTYQWDESLDYNKFKGTSPSILGTSTSNGRHPGITNSNFYFYATPPTDILTKNIVEYNANNKFGTASTETISVGITNFNLSEMDYRIQGFAFYKWGDFPYSRLGTSSTFTGALPQNGLGWTYDANYNSTELLHWYDDSQVNLNPVGGGSTTKIGSVGYRQNNYIAKFVPYTYFNFSFNYQNQHGDFPLEIYLSSILPTNNPGSFSKPTNALLIGTLTHSFSGTYSSRSYSIPHKFFSLEGGKYIYFKGPFVGTQSSATYSSIFITDIVVEGGYHPGNNEQYQTTNVTSIIPYGLTGATYSTYVGSGNTINATQSLSISQINANIGNGTFKSGVWENGVWNSGWRYDDSVQEFSKIYQYFTYNKSKRWRIQIEGPSDAVNSFEIGDKVSIGNIIAIDINENRKTIKGYFTIINKTETTIIVEFDNDFPLRRIEKDSDNHRIYVTKNVWLSGAFFNGYFRGVWNYGLFKGYPMITEMYDTHWVDGIFDGGHFNTSYYTIPKFVDTLFYPNETFGGRVGLTFSGKHGLAVGDTILVDKDNKNINPQYDGETTIDNVINDYHIVTALSWGSDSTSEGGTVSVTLSKGVIQKMQFKSKNRSKITSNQSLESTSVFIYDSWMDVNYYNTSAVNIGKPQSLSNTLSGKEYSENNLYGYPTNDILESKSTFRDSFSNTIREYSLGTKYKIFNDYIGDAGNFQEQFGSTRAYNPIGTPTASVVRNSSESKFINLGWTYSRYDDSSLTFSRTFDIGEEGIIGQELLVRAIGRGGILDIYPLADDEIVDNRTNDTIKRLRYTAIEFDLVSHSDLNIGLAEQLEDGTFIDSSVPTLDIFQKLSLFAGDASGGAYITPMLHFNNINTTLRSTYYSTLGSTVSTFIPASYLPIFKNVNHLTSSKKRKIEYFYNKRNLSMNFSGDVGYFVGRYMPSSTFDYVIDNLKFIEIDMVPFFQYFIESNINKGVQVPFQGISPYIDYSNPFFDFLDNISLGFSSIAISSSNLPFSGVGAGILTSNPAANNPAGGLFVPPEDTRFLLML
jgi:hypothetical protein